MISTTQLPVRILVIEDDNNDFIILRDYLQSIPSNNFIIEWSYQYYDALDRMCKTEYDLYFIDYFLGHKTGLDLFEEAIAKGFNGPVILLTGMNNYVIDVKAMNTGVVDYLVKSDLNTEKLERCIRYSLDRSNSLSALKANERKFHSIFEKSRDAIFLADDELYFKEINNAGTELLKFERREFLQLSLYSLFAEHGSSEKMWAQLRTQGHVESFETELIAKDRERKWFILSISKENGQEGGLYFQGIMRDITNLKKIEKANRQIEKLRSTSMLLRTLTHEIRNPLTNIALSIDQLKTETNTDNLAFAIIDRNLNRINSMVTELLNSSRPGEMTPEEIMVQSILDETIEIAKDRILLHKIELVKRYPKENVFIIADSGKIKMAFLNIIINAIEAMEQGNGVLTISIIKNADCCNVLIEDNGHGISEENLNKIFEPYYTSKSNGFGLGLAATLSILQSHNAQIDVQSNIGSGTCFNISFNASAEVLVPV